MLFAPGAACEGYFEGIGKVAAMTDDERREFFVRYDSFFTDMVNGPAEESWESRAAARRAFKTR